MMYKIMSILKVAGVVVLLPILLYFGRMWKKRNKFRQKQSQATGNKQNSVNQNKAGQQEKDIGEQVKHLVDLRAEADRAEAEIAYSRLFGEIGLAIQKLFALAKEEEEREGYGRILREEIQTPIKDAFRTYHVTFTDEGISLSVGRAEADPGLMNRLKQLSASDLDKAIRECEGRIKRARTYEIPKGAVNRAAGSLRSLTETPAAELGWQKLKELSGAIETAFVESGIYPLYRRDKKVLERPDLCALFIEVRGNELIWPGLFTENDNKLQMYGNFQGTCHKGEWDEKREFK